MIPPLIVTTDLPPALLSPNARPSWRVRWQAQQVYKGVVWADCKAALALYRVDHKAAWNGQAGSYTLNLHAYYREQRGRDDDNLIASFKAGRDGMTLAGAWADDKQARVRWVVMDTDKQRPRLVLTVHLAEKQEIDT